MKKYLLFTLIATTFSLAAFSANKEPEQNEKKVKLTKQFDNLLKNKNYDFRQYPHEITVYLICGGSVDVTVLTNSTSWTSEDFTRAANFEDIKNCGYTYPGQGLPDTPPSQN